MDAMVNAASSSHLQLLQITAMEEEKKKSVWSMVFEVIKVIAAMLAGYFGGNAVM